MSVYINHSRNYIHEHVTVCASNRHCVAKTCALPKLQVVVTIYTPGSSVSDGAACEVKYDHSNGCYAIVVL